MKQSEGMEDIKRKLEQLASQISAGRIGSAPHWGGADVVISDSDPEARQLGFYADPRWVVTPSASELSWLFIELMDAFDPVYDYQMKYEFFGRLANAALRYHAQSQGQDDTRDLLLAVVHEAFAMADELAEGSFRALGIAIGNEIVGDHTPDAERRGFVGVEETKRFFADKGIEV